MKYKRLFIAAITISQLFFWLYMISLSLLKKPSLSYALFTFFIGLLALSFFLYFIAISKIVEHGRAKFDLKILEYENSLKDKEKIQLETLVKDNAQYKMYITEQLNTLFHNLETNSPDQLKKHLHVLDTKLHSKKPYYYCSNSLLNAIFHEKKRDADEKNISLEYIISLPEAFSIPQNELASIFFNLLDNALEACAHSDIPNPFIRLKTTYQGNILSIHMQNSKNPAVIFNQKTSKRNLQLHGFGLSIIENIVSSHNGHATWIDHRLTFESILMLEIN